MIVKEQLESRQTTISFDDNEVIAGRVINDEQRFAGEVAVARNGHGHFVDRGLGPKPAHEFGLRKLRASVTAARQSRVLRV
jgi:hypothetical protein